MKKIIIIFASIFVSLASFAQGSFGIEVNVDPFGTSANQSIFSTNGLKLRYFLIERLAVRGTFNFSMNSTTNYDYEYAGSGKNVEYEGKGNVINFGVVPGIEYHLVKLEKGAVYAGVECGFAIQNASYKETNDDDDSSLMLVVTGYDGNENRSNTTLNIGIFTGVDYYLTKNLYVGAELGLRYNSTKDKDVVAEFTNYGGQLFEDVYEKHPKRKRLGFVPTFRFGWTF